MWRSNWFMEMVVGIVALTSVFCLPLRGDEPIRVACVGDSITFGWAASKGNTYPEQLGRMLGEKWSVMNCGVNSLTLLNQGDAPYQKRGPMKGALEFQPNIVVIMLGTNDTKPNNWKFKESFIADYKDLISKFAALPSKPRIYICRPAFVPGKGSWGINEAAILEQIPMLDKIAADEKATIIDVHAALKDRPELYLADNVHPNMEGVTVIAKTVFHALTGKEFSGSVLVEPPAPKAGK